MAKRSLKNLALFVAGEPESDFPDTLYMQYSVSCGAAEKTNLVYEIADPDPDMILEEVWASAVSEIKELESIE